MCTYFAIILLKHYYKVFQKKELKVKIYKIYYLLLFLSAVLISIAFFDVSMFDMYIDRMFTKVVELDFLSERMHNWEKAYFLQSTNVFNYFTGIGINGSEVVFNKEYAINDANYFKVFVEQGLVGFLLYMSLPLYILYKLLFAKNNLEVILLYLTISYFLIGITSNIINYYIFPHLLFISLGVYYGTKNSFIKN